MSGYLESTQMSNLAVTVTNLVGKIGVPIPEEITSKNEYLTSAIPTTLLLECNVWITGSRVALQVILLVMMLLNIAAAIVVFGVPINVRGRHVAFLFICVRVLNILDLYQCAVIFFSPFGMPANCQNPNVVYCNISGFCFATGTILSPLVAIVMALDRFFAVFFHLRYKAKPQTMRKCVLLAGLMGTYILYFTLPFYTNFGKYVAVPWLSLCAFEWGIEYRMFNLILFATTSCLTMVLMVANIAIIFKVHKGKEEFKRLKETQRNMAMQNNRKNEDISKKHGLILRKCKSVGDLSMPSFSRGPHRPASSLLQRRGALLPPLQFSLSPTNDFPHNERHIEIEINTISPPCDTTMLFPPVTFHSSMSPGGSLPPSPLTISENEFSPAPRTQTLLYQGREMKRLASSCRSADFDRAQVSPLIHRTTSPDNLRKKALENRSKGKLDRSCESFLDKLGHSKAEDRESNNSTSSNSLLSNFLGSRWRSLRQSRDTKPKKLRRNVSRITKMTTAVCTLFCVLYVPFLVRKLVQITPLEYNQTVPPAIEIITLFGPLLSPLINPILYVFFNPHYRKKCESLYNRIRCFGKSQTTSKYFVNVSTTRGELKSSRYQSPKNKRKLNMFESENSEIKASFNHHNDDVFVSTGRMNPDIAIESDSNSICSTVKDENIRRSMRQSQLNKIQNLHYRRAKSADYLC